MKKILTYAFIAFLSTQFLNAQWLPFQLHGKLVTNPHSLVQLASFTKNTLKVDTALMIGDSFVIRGKLKNPHMVLLEIKTDSIVRPSNYFFVDSGEHNLKITLNDSVFRIDNVSNSPIQDEYLNHFLPFIYVKENHNLPTNENILTAKRSFEDNFWGIDMDFILEYLQMHSRSYLGFLIFAKKISFSRPERNEFYQKLFMSLDTAIRHTASGKEILKLLLNENSMLVGKKFPQFVLKDINNKVATVNYKGNSFTLIDYWATWCGPCLREIPTFKTIYNKYKSKKFNIISISVDYTRDLPKFKKIIDSLQMNWTHYWDEDGEIAFKYKIFALPTYFLLNDKGEIITRGNRMKPILEIIEKKLK